MKNKQALKYIHEHKKEGVEDHTIKSSFSRVGWHPHAIESLFEEYNIYRKKLIKNKKIFLSSGIIILALFLIGVIILFVYLNWF